MEKCYHCGDDCGKMPIVHDSKNFCCHGCKTVYEMLQENNLDYYYDLERNPGLVPPEIKGKYEFLDNPEIAAKLIEFDEQDTQVTTFLIPSMHCSSCIWVLENLNKLNPAVKSAIVNFPEKKVRITYDSTSLSIKNLVLLMSHIGYEPYISLEDYDKQEKATDRSLLYKLGWAGFAFGNIMLLSFPEYFEVSEFWLDRYKFLFRGIMLVYAIPVVFYSGRDYLISAYKGVRSNILNIDVPIAIGILALFLRSVLEVVMNWGSGYFDSLSGLVFFLLIGRYFQQKTYGYLSFERDYKSYFPIAVTRLTKTEGSTTRHEEQVEVYDIAKGDRVIIRNNELIPVDAVLLKGQAFIDYSFVTGEAEPVLKQAGDKLYAGGKQQGGLIEIEVIHTVDQSYLTQLWSKEVFKTDKKSAFTSLTDKISRKFTLIILGIAIAATLFWFIVDASIALHVFTAVLIVACPCALALAAPFTMGNLLRIFGRNRLYLRESTIIEQMAAIDTVVFDKTGTLTTSKQNLVRYEGITLNSVEENLLTSTLRTSNHPLSRALYQMLKDNEIDSLDDFKEEVGKGIMGVKDQHSIKIGSYAFTQPKQSGFTPTSSEFSIGNTTVHISTDEEYKGCYIFENEYRTGLEVVIERLSGYSQIVVLSGDNAGEKERLEKMLPVGSQILFNQKPEDKLDYIKSLQDTGKKVMMIGDGLNDSGALAQSNVGIALSENINVFSPACDGILDARNFKNIADFISLSRKGIQVIKWSFIFSLIYNTIGLGFAVTGNLKPVIAAILMPLSSISVVIFTTMATYLLGIKVLGK